SLGKNAEWAAVQTTVADKHQSSGDLVVSVRCGNTPGRAEQRLQTRQDVSQWAHPLLQLPANQLNSACVQASAGQLGEVAYAACSIGPIFNLGKIDDRFLAFPYRDPGSLRLQRNVELTGKDVNRSERHNTQTGPFKAFWRITQPVENLVNG